jgi:acetyltransferase-like isoleucine patch superfamily enzyme
MSIVIKLRKGEGPFWGGLKRLAHKALRLHLPADGLARPLFASLYRLHLFGREATGWALRFLWYEPLFRSQCASVGEGLRMEQLPYMTGRGRIVVGAMVQLSGKPAMTFCNRYVPDPELSLGDGTFVGHGCSFAVADSVRIGRHSLLAAGVAVRDYDGHPLEAAPRRAGALAPREEVKPVVIGDDVWVGGGALILKGVTIGDRAVVAARSVVTRDVPPDAVVAGNPARVVKTLAPDDQA